MLHAWHGIPGASLRLLWAALLGLLTFSFFAMFHNPFRDMKPPTSNSSRGLFRSFLVTLLFSPSISHPLAFLPGTLSSSSVEISFQTSFHLLLCPFPPACIDSSMLVLVFVAHQPNIFGTKLKLLHFDPILLTMPCAPKCGLLHLPSLCLESSRNHFGPSHVPCIFVFLLLLPHPIHTTSFDVSSLPLVFVDFLCFETVASWQQCIAYNTTSARWSVPVRNLCLAKD